MKIVLWFFAWFSIWAIFNVRLNWKILKAKKGKHWVISSFFLLSSIVVFLMFKALVFESTKLILLGFILNFFMGIFFSNFYPYRKHIRNGRCFLISLSFDILMQQIMILAGVKMLSQYFGSNYRDAYFGLMFLSAHLPAIFFKWAKLRYLLIPSTLIGGVLFSYLIRSYTGTGILLSSLLHYTLYIPVFYYLRDEARI